MTIIGYLLVTVISNSTLFETPTFASTQVLLPPTANCDKVASTLVSNKKASDAFCIPVYDK